MSRTSFALTEAGELIEITPKTLQLLFGAERQKASVSQVSVFSLWSAVPNEIPIWVAHLLGTYYTVTDIPKLGKWMFMTIPSNLIEKQTSVGLEHLFGSKTRVKLLSLFLQHPDEQFYVRELMRRIGAQLHSVRRELANLSLLGVVVFTGGTGGKGFASSLRKKYFRANRECVLYHELQSLLRKAQILLEKNLVARISGLGDVRYLALCGRLIGERGPTDLLIVGKISGSVISKLIKRFEQEVGYEVNYTLLTPDEFSYRRDIADRFLYAILEGKKLVMIDKMGWNV